MPDVKISALPEATSISSTDVAPVVTGGITKKASAATIVKAVLPAPGAIGSTTPDTGAFTTLTATNAAGVQNVSSTNTNYTASGTGAVQRTVANKLEEFVSVKDFGAVCDGVTDDTANVNLAIAASQFVYINPECKYTRGSLTGTSSAVIVDDSRGVRVTNNDYWWKPGPQKFELIAHRGFAGISPEDTMTAYTHAVGLGVQILETDVQISLDGVPVLIHDDTVDRTTNGTGYVKDKTYAQLRALSAGIKFNAKFTATKIPSFEEFVTFGQSRTLMMYPEIKGYRTQADIDVMLDVVYAHEAEQLTVFQSFNLSDLQYVRVRNKNVGVGYLANNISQLSSVAALGGRCYYLLDYTAVIANPTWINTCRSEGVDIAVWTVNNFDSVKALLDLGVTKIMSNYWWGDGA